MREVGAMPTLVVGMPAQVRHADDSAGVTSRILEHLDDVPGQALVDLAVAGTGWQALLVGF